MKALEIFAIESERKINQKAYDMITDAVKAIQEPKKDISIKKPFEVKSALSVPILKERIIENIKLMNSSDLIFLRHIYISAEDYSKEYNIRENQ